MAQIAASSREDPRELFSSRPIIAEAELDFLAQAPLKWHELEDAEILKEP